MKRYLVILLLSAACFGQVSSGTARRIVGGTKPATCSAGPPADVWVDTVASPHALNLCTSTNTWTAVGGGGGGAVTSVFTRTGAVTAQSADYGLGLIGNPAAGTTFSYATNQNSDWVFQGTGSFNVTGVSTVTGVENNTSLFTLKRFTDTSPTGKMLDFQNAIGGSVASIGIDGTPTFPAFVLANGATATTQSAADNSTKLATTAYADAAVAAAVGDTPWVTALSVPGPGDPHRVILHNTTGTDDLRYNGEKLWHTDAWVWLDAMSSDASAFTVGGTMHSPVWLAYLSSTQNVSGTNVFPELHMLHLATAPTLDFRSTTVAGVLELNDVITDNGANQFQFSTATLNGDVTLKSLTGTAATFHANNPIGGRLTMDTIPSLTQITATAARMTFVNMANADTGSIAAYSLTWTGGNGDLVFTAPCPNSSELDVAIDGTSSTATTLDLSCLQPVDASGNANVGIQNAPLLSSVTLPGSPVHWSLFSFSGDALNQANVDAIIAASIVPGSGAVVQGGGTVDVSGGTNSPPSVTGLADINTQIFTVGGGTNSYVAWNHVADFAITAVNQGTKTFTIAGDQSANTRLNTAGVIIQVQGSTGNDNYYTVVSATLNAGSTDIVVTQAIPNATANGTIGN